MSIVKRRPRYSERKAVGGGGTVVQSIRFAPDSQVGFEAFFVVANADLQ